MRNWRDLYSKVLLEKAKGAKPEGEVQVTKLSFKKHWKAASSGRKVRRALTTANSIHEGQRILLIGTSLVIGMESGILLKHNRSQLEKYGGMIKLNKEWAKSPQ